MTDAAAPEPEDTSTLADRPDDYRPAGRYPVDTSAAEAPSKPDDEVIHLAGRVVLWRKFGGLAFGHIQDQSGKVQVSLKKNDLGVDQFKAWVNDISIGDFIGVTGTMWTTDKGERTVAVSDLTILSRGFRSMPDKWAGVNDTEIRYRKRYLDLLANDESRERFRTRTRVISLIRRELDANDFIEIETPILQGAASGAAARPFSTHHNALDRDFYLRISPETYLKRVHRRLVRPRLRDRPELPQRGGRLLAPAGVHDARVVRRLLGLPRQHGVHPAARADRDPGRRADR